MSNIITQKTHDKFLKIMTDHKIEILRKNNDPFYEISLKIKGKEISNTNLKKTIDVIYNILSKNNEKDIYLLKEIIDGVHKTLFEKQKTKNKKIRKKL